MLINALYHRFILTSIKAKRKNRNKKNIQAYIYNIRRKGGIFMEYTKDIILSMKENKGINKERISLFFKFIKNNKFILSLISITVIFMACDVVLVNIFIKLLTKI